MKSTILFFALIATSFANLIEISKINGNPLYDFPQNSGVFVISDGKSDDVLKTIQITQRSTNVAKTAYELSIPDASGKLTPFQNTGATADLVQITIQNGQNYNIPGYIYITNSTLAPNVYVQQDVNNNLKISSAGTNLFFPLNSQLAIISVVTGLSVPQGSTVKAFVGVPENSQPVFDSYLFNTSYFYDQLDFPVDYFYLTSSDAKVSYNVSTALQMKNLEINSLSVSGLLMTPNYPANVTSSQTTFAFSNKNNASAFVHLYPYFINLPGAVYTTNFTITSVGQEQTFPASSQSVYFDLQLKPQLNKIVVSSDGQYAVQFAVQDLSQTTTQNPFQSTTQGAESISHIFSVLVAPLILLRLF